MAEELKDREMDNEVGVDEELEDGKIPDDESSEDSSAVNRGELITTQLHPLEHKWTFWFDDPSAKSKQSAWGSSMRPIYTFHTVEDFWR